jgi:cytochrome oxidase Cu insertion factor (SCO1/SenC/PrrC family)
MKRSLAIAVLLAGVAVTLRAGGRVSAAQEFPVGAAIPTIDLIDDTGRTRSTAEWRGTPTILAPMYARCPVACPLIGQGLKTGTGESSADPSTYRVVIFSFDARDTPADLHRFRARHNLPLAWTVVTAKPADTRRLLDAIGYRVGDANGLLAHPNVVVALTPDLKTAKYLAGTTYRGRDIDEALNIARGGRDWIAQLGGWVLAILLLVCALSAVYLFTLFGIRPTDAARPAIAAPPPHHSGA